MPPQPGESDMVWDAVQVRRGPAVDRLFMGHWESFLRDRGVPAPYGCEYTGSIPAREMKPPYVCPNEVEWAVLAPATYHYRQEEYEGGEVPIERRDAFAFLCRDCATRFFKNVKFHGDLEYHFPGVSNE